MHTVNVEVSWIFPSSEVLNCGALHFPMKIEEFENIDSIRQRVLKLVEEEILKRGRHDPSLAVIQKMNFDPPLIKILTR